MGDMRGKTIGLVGFGYIGRLVARKLSNFNVNILVYDPFINPETLKEFGAESVSLKELCNKSDFVSIHARLSKETEGLIGKEALFWISQLHILLILRGWINS